jgi:CDP-6-deoxy-D-xylo-4-hexulose-3-dehydrase
VDGVPWDHKYEFVLPGGNFKPGFDIQGVIGLNQLRKEEIYRERRKRNHGIISGKISLCGDVIKFAMRKNGSDPCWFGFAIGIKKGDRKEIIKELETAGVGTRLVFGGNLARQKFARDRCLIPIGIESADDVMQNWFIVGCNQTITEEEAHYIGDTVKWAVTG